MHTSKIKYTDIALQFEEIKAKTFNLLKDFGKQEVINDLNESLGKLEDRQELKVAFVGQYNSGKSTIISAITGNNKICIDSNVATDQCCDYTWNKIKLTDTPGILAGKVERHDKATTNAILNTDLIVYVLTSQLFDDLIFENFIDLAYNQNLKNKMLIAINKMSMESGDFETLQANYLDSIKSTFKERGYTFDFDVIFIDAADYIEGLEEKEEDLVELSNFHDFIHQLNEFVGKKGLVQKKFDTPTRLLRNAVSDVALQKEDSSFALTSKKYESRLRRYKKDVSQEIEFMLNRLKTSIMDKGYTISSMVDQIDTDELKKRQDAFEIFLEKESKEKMFQIETLINTKRQLLAEELTVLNEDEDIALYRDQLTQINLGNKSSNQSKSSEKKLQFLNLLKDNTSHLMKYTGADKSSRIFMTLGDSSGSQVHGLVKNIGGKIGYKFKPWEAVKISKNMGNISKFAGPALSGIMLGVEIVDFVKEERKLKKVVASKQQMNSEFVDIASEVVTQIKQGVVDYLKSTIDSKLSDFDNKKQEIIDICESNSKFSKEATIINAEYSDFFERLKYEVAN